MKKGKMARIVLISNVVLEPYWCPCMEASFAASECVARTTCLAYEELDGHLTALEDVDVVVVCLNFETLYPNISNDTISENLSLGDVEQDAIERCRRLYERVKSCSTAKIIWFGFEDYAFHHDHLYGAIPAFGGLVDRINLLLMNMLGRDAYIDLKRLIAKMGISDSYDNKGKYRWNAPYSKSFVSMMADEVHKQFLIDNGKTKKCLILDCDNVLWGGILSEDGIEGIQISSDGLGRPFQDFQRFLLDMYHHGVILAVCSKNDEADVLKVFQEHSGMLLKEEHIACFRCNWDDKPGNIRAIAEGLNIGLDSMVFVDDSPFELEAVRYMLPEVRTVQYHRDTVYHELSCFHLQSNVDRDTVKSRIETYKSNQKREQLKKSAASFDQYISSLKMKIDIHNTSDHELARVAELTQRTNQCTNGVRYTLAQLKERQVNPDYELYTVCLSDRFSDLGIVGVVGIHENVVDLFSLSCRALGRKVEHAMLQYAVNQGANAADFVRTSKNEGIRELFFSYGVSAASRADG